VRMRSSRADVFHLFVYSCGQRIVACLRSSYVWLHALPRLLRTRPAPRPSRSPRDEWLLWCIFDGWTLRAYVTDGAKLGNSTVSSLATHDACRAVRRASRKPTQWAE
jgi:hypothetical protein